MKNAFPDSPLSLWLDTYGPYQPDPPLQGDLTVDVAVIGGGFTGIASAHELKRAEPSLKVAVLEAKTIGYGASGRNGSFAMTVVGLGFGVTAMLRGSPKTTSPECRPIFGLAPGRWVGQAKTCFFKRIVRGSGQEPPLLCRRERRKTRG